MRSSATRLLSSVAAAGVVKRSTGLAGLPVVPNAREVLVKLYSKTLKDVQVRGWWVRARVWSGGEALVCTAHSQMASQHPKVPLRRPAAPQGLPNVAEAAHLPLPPSPIQIIPPDVHYRKMVEAFTQFRMNVVKENTDVRVRGGRPAAQRCSVFAQLSTQHLAPLPRTSSPLHTPSPTPLALPPQIDEIERIIGCGQVEQLIEQAKGELIVIPEYASWKMWEMPAASPDEEDFTDFYDELEYVDPDSVAYLGLKDLATKRRAEAASKREAGETNQARADVNAAAAAAAEARKQAQAAAAAAAAAAAKPK